MRVPYDGLVLVRPGRDIDTLGAAIIFVSGRCVRNQVHIKVYDVFLPSQGVLAGKHVIAEFAAELLLLCVDLEMVLDAFQPAKDLERNLHKLDA